MRTFKGYAMRKVRRQFYRDIRNVNNRNNTYVEYQPKEKLTIADYYIIAAWFISPILIILFISQI